jgi:hypothetical protein
MSFSVEKKKSTEKDVEYYWALKDPQATLTDPDIWIAGTGATVHSTANVLFANYWEPDTRNTVTVMGNVEKEKVTKIGIVEGIFKDKDRMNQGNNVLSDVIFLHISKNNLISVIKVMKNGWNLEDNSNHIKS